MERLWRLEGVNILKGRVRAECMERSHVAAENTGEHWRMLGMKFYVTGWHNVHHRAITEPSWNLSGSHGTALEVSRIHLGTFTILIMCQTLKEVSVLYLLFQSLLLLRTSPLSCSIKGLDT